jgi:Ca-activated chloride channel family protein
VLRRAATAFSLLILATVAAAQTFHNAVNLVVVPVSVSDPGGQFVSKLSREDFTLYEDGQERPIETFTAERVPVSLGTLVDISGSMLGVRFADARTAMDKLLERLGPDDRVFLSTFNEMFKMVTPWTADHRAITNAMAGVTPKGGTFLYRAISTALPILNEGPNKKKALVIISDGEDNEGVGGTQNREGLARAVAQATASEAVIYVVGIGPPKPSAEEMLKLARDPVTRRGLMYDPPIDVNELRRLTDPTGGYTQLVPTSATLTSTVIRIVDDLSNQYVLSFESAHPHDGEPHAIRVTAKNKNLQIRARTTYSDSSK